MKKNTEFENFDAAMRKLISVPHDKIKAELDAEKDRKRMAKKREKSTSAKRTPRANDR
jgi:hypothetical protein